MATLFARSLFRSRTASLKLVSQIVSSRGYADRMSFTFASPYEVSFNNTRFCRLETLINPTLQLQGILQQL
jgi:hypothetical protein